MNQGGINPVNVNFMSQSLHYQIFAMESCQTAFLG